MERTHRAKKTGSHCCHNTRGDREQSYRYSIAALSFVGFLLNCQPSEPYLTEYMHRVKAIPMHDVNDAVYPWSTWSSFAALLPAAALAECWGYRRTIIAGVMLREATRVLLILHDDIKALPSTLQGYWHLRAQVWTR